MSSTRHTSKTSPESLRPRLTPKASTSPVRSRSKGSQKKSQTKSAIATSKFSFRKHSLISPIDIAHNNMQQFSRLTPDEKELLEIVKRSGPKSPEKALRDNAKSSVHSEKGKVYAKKGTTQSIPKSPRTSVNKGSSKKVTRKVPIEEKENEEDEVIELPRERKAQDLMIPDPISGFFRDANGRLTPNTDLLESGLGKRPKSTGENINSKNSSAKKNSERSRRMSSNASPISRANEKRTPVEELSSRLDVIFEDSQYDIQIDVQRVGESNRLYVTSFSQEVAEMEILNRNSENKKKNNDVMEIEDKPVITVPKIEILPPRRTALKTVVRRMESLHSPPRRRLLTRDSEILDYAPEVINIEDNKPQEVIEVIEEEPKQNLDDSAIRITLKDGGACNEEEEEGEEGDVVEITEITKPKSESIKSEEDRISENFKKQRNKLQRWREQHENLMSNTIANSINQASIVEIVDETDRMEIEENKQPQQTEEIPEHENQTQITKAGDLNVMEVIEESPSAEEGTQGERMQESESLKEDSENREDQIQTDDPNNEAMNNQTQEKEQISEVIIETTEVFITEIVTATQYVESQELRGLTIARRFIPRAPSTEDDKPAETQEETSEHDDREQIQDENRDAVQDVSAQDAVEISGQLENEENQNGKIILSEEVNQPGLDEMQEETVVPKTDNNNIQTESHQANLQEEMVPEMKEQDSQANSISAPVEIQEEMVIEIKKSQGQGEENNEIVVSEEKDNVEAENENEGEESSPIRQEEMTPEIKDNDREAIVPEDNDHIQGSEEQIDEPVPTAPEIKESQGQVEENNRQDLIEIPEQMEFTQAITQEEEEVKSSPQTHEDQIGQYAPIEMQEEMVIETKEIQAQEEENNRLGLIGVPEQMIIPEENTYNQAQIEELQVPEVQDDVEGHDDKIGQSIPGEMQEEMVIETKEIQAQEEENNRLGLIGVPEQMIIPEENTYNQAQIEELQVPEVQDDVEGHDDKIGQSIPGEMQEEMVIETKEIQVHEEENNEQDLIKMPEQIIPEERCNAQAQIGIEQEETIPEIKENHQEAIAPFDELVQAENQEEMITEIRESQGQIQGSSPQTLVEAPEEIIPEEKENIQADYFSNPVQAQEEIIPEEEAFDNQRNQPSPIKESQTPTEMQVQDDQIDHSAPAEIQEEMVMEAKESQGGQEGQEEESSRQQELAEISEQIIVPEEKVSDQVQSEEANNESPIRERQEEILPEQKESIQENYGDDENKQHEMQEEIIPEVDSSPAPVPINHSSEMERVDAPKDETLERDRANIDDSLSNKEAPEEFLQEMKPETPGQSQPTIIIAETQITADAVKNSQPTFIIAETQELEVNNNNTDVMVNILEPINEAERELEVAESPEKVSQGPQNNERMEILDLPREQEAESEHKEVSQEPIQESGEQMEILESPKETEARDKQIIPQESSQQIEILESPKAQIQEPGTQFQDNQEQIHAEVRIFEISRVPNTEAMEILDGPVVIEVEHKEAEPEIEISESPNEVEFVKEVMEILDSPGKEVIEITAQESPKAQEGNEDLIILGSEIKEYQVEIVSVGSPHVIEEIHIDSSKKDERESQHDEVEEISQQQHEEIEILESEHEEEKQQEGKTNLIQEIYREFVREDIIELDQQEVIVKETTTYEVNEALNVTEQEILQNYIKQPRIQSNIQEDDDDDTSEYKEEGDIEESPQEEIYQGDEDSPLEKEEEGIHHEYQSESAKKSSSHARREYTVYEDWRILESLAAYERQNGPAGSKSIKTWETLKDPLTKRRLLEDERTAESLKNRMHKTLYFLTDEDKKQIFDYIKSHSKEEAMAVFCRFEHDRHPDKKKFKGIFTDLHYSVESSHRKTPKSASSKKKDKANKSYGLIQKAFEDNETEENDEVEDIVIPIDEYSLPRENMFYPSMGEVSSHEGFITEPNSLNYEVSFNQPFSYVTSNSRSNSNKKIVRTNKDHNTNNDDIRFVSAAKKNPIFKIYQEEQPLPHPKEEVAYISRMEAMQQHQGSGSKGERQKESKKRKDYRIPNAPVEPEEFANCLKKVKTTKYFEQRSLLISEEFKYKLSAEKEKFKPPSKDINVFVHPEHNFRQFVLENSQQTEENSSQNLIIERLAQIAAKHHMHQEDVLRIFHAVSNDFDDLLLYLKTKNEFIPWEPSEDQDLLENDPTAVRYLRQLKGDERMNRRREYLMGE